MSEAILQPVPEKIHKNDTVLYKQIEPPEKQDLLQ
jgi:hypothetical protein